MSYSMEEFRLVQQLSSPDADVRQAAAQALQGSTITNGHAAFFLVQQLNSPDADVRQAAAQALEGTRITYPPALQLLALLGSR
jgi:HEAT repeat protein